MGDQCRWLQFGMVAWFADRWGDACTDYDILSATDLHKRRWIMQVCLAHLYFILIKRKAIFQSAPTNPQEKLGPSFQGTQPGSLCN